jgi:PAS domain S-box-containing protein
MQNESATSSSATQFDHTKLTENIGRLNLLSVDSIISLMLLLAVLSILAFNYIVFFSQASNPGQQLAIAAIPLIVIAWVLRFTLNRILIKPIKRLNASAKQLHQHASHPMPCAISKEDAGIIYPTLNSLNALARENAQVQKRISMLSTIIEHTNYEVYEVDVNSYRILNSNQLAWTNLGYSQSELETLAPWDFVDDLTPENIDDFLAPLREGIIPARIFETVHRRKDGSTYSVKTRIQYMSELSPAVFAVTVQDITEFNQQAADLQLLYRAVNAVNVGIIISDTSKEQAPILYVNEAMCEMSGYTEEELIGKSPSLLQGDDQSQAGTQQILAAQRKGQPVQARLNSVRKDGRPFIADILLSPFHDLEGELTHYIGVHQDITEKLNTEACLLQSQKLDSIGRLSSGIAHDFNNHICVTLGNLELLKTMETDSDKRDFITMCEDSLNMATRLSRRLLAFSSEGSIEPAVIDLNTLVMKMRDILRSTLLNSIDFSCTLSPEIWTICADRSQMENTIVNLVINARDAMPTGGHLDLKTENVDRCEGGDDLALKPGQYVKLTVTDDGSGMSDDIRTRVFEPYFSTKDSAKGTGLGISVIYGFVKQSGGYIDIRSVPGHGTSVEVYLPRHNEAEECPKTASEGVDIITTDKQQRIS